MKIHYISTSIIPSKYANAVHVMKMCEAFSENSHEVTLLARKPKQKQNQDPYKYYNVKNSFNIKFLNQYQIPIIGSTLYAFKAVGLCKKQKPELVYTRNIVAAYFATKAGLDTVFECHKVMNRRLKSLMLSYLIKKTNFKQIVVISKRLKQALTQQHPHICKKISVFHDGVDIERYAIMPSKSETRRYLRFNPSATIVMYTGQLYKGKGAEILPYVAQKLPNVYFCIVGGVEQDVVKLKETINGLKICNIRMEGYVPHAEVIKYLAVADVLVMPYQKKVTVDNTGDIALGMSPLKMFEYMAAGKPIISSKLPVLQEVLTHEKNAILVEPDCIDQWVKAIKTMMQDQQLVDTLINNQLKDVREYSWNRRSEKIIEAVEMSYEQIKEKNRGKIG